MPKVKCRKCGTSCCTCSGCDPKKYVDGLCPMCQKLKNEATNKNTGMSELRITEGTPGANRLQPAESIKE